MATELIEYDNDYSLHALPKEVWAQSFKMVASFAQRFAEAILCRTIEVEVVYLPTVGWPAMYSGGVLYLFLSTLGYKWFEDFPKNLTSVVELLLEQFAHEYEPTLVSNDSTKALTRVSVQTIMLAHHRPQVLWDAIHGEVL